MYICEFARQFNKDTLDRTWVITKFTAKYYIFHLLHMIYFVFTFEGFNEGRDAVSITDAGCGKHKSKESMSLLRGIFEDNFLAKI